MDVRVYKILEHTKVEGPGIRFCIWFQGCSRHCKGCRAKATWDFNGGKLIDADYILEKIKNNKLIEGVTFLGGEPFEQPLALKYLAKNIQKLGLTVLCFTGYKFEDLNKNHGNILKYIDLLIDGEYVEEKQNFSRPWVGSENQRYFFLSKKYNESILNEYKNKIEINVEKNGHIFINGMGNFEELTKKLNILSFH